jgi:hypothetical protein
MYLLFITRNSVEPTYGGSTRIHKTVVVNSPVVAEPDGDAQVLARPVHCLEDIDRF